MSIFANADAYKLSHWDMLPENVQYVYSNLTPRKSLRPGIDKFVFFGLQAFIQKLHTEFQKHFFLLPRVYAVREYIEFYKEFFGAAPKESLVRCVESLHGLGFLPIEILALPEGNVVDHGIPVCVIFNTRPGFAWLPNFIESWLSAEIWLPSTSATTAFYYRKKFDEFAAKTSDQDFMPEFQGHDFSFRGMCGIEAASMSGAGHLLSFKGTDTLPAIAWIEKYYGPTEGMMIGTSVPATEHSVMCAGGKETELETFRRLLKLYPTGILSVVSDTWDFWQVVTQILPQLREEIMARDGKLVIRPDSGDPVKILCGDSTVRISPKASQEETLARHAAFHGLIQSLFEIFGGTVNSKGYIDLDPHIGAIYGDSITLERQAMILGRLQRKGFASTNVVLGIGSYTYQYVTRDTHGLAVKATAVGDADNNITPIYKDPKTDTSGKKSAKGLLAVNLEYDEADGEYFTLRQEATVAEMRASDLQTVYRDGDIANRRTFIQIRELVNIWQKRLA